MLPLWLALLDPAAAWDTKPFLRPQADVILFDGGNGVETVVNLGLQGGLAYWETDEVDPRWQGRTRAAGSYGFGLPGVKATDIRLGSFMGPAFDPISFESGLDVFRNELTIDGFGLQPSVGIDVPLLAALDFEAVGFWAGIGTAYLFNADRRVDWSETESFGFGHEFQYVLGASVSVGISLSAQYTHRVVATGTQQSIGLGVRL